MKEKGSCLLLSLTLLLEQTRIIDKEIVNIDDYLHCFSMNKTFATFGKFLKKERYLESIAAHFLQLPSYRRFPNDDEFEREIQNRDLYNFRHRSY